MTYLDLYSMVSALQTVDLLDCFNYYKTPICQFKSEKQGFWLVSFEPQLQNPRPKAQGAMLYDDSVIMLSSENWSLYSNILIKGDHFLALKGVIEEGILCKAAGRQAGKQASKQTGKQVNRQTGKLAGRQASKHAGKQVGKQAGITHINSINL